MQISQTKAENGIGNGRKKMAAAAAISITNFGMSSRNEKVTPLQALGSSAMAALTFIYFTLISKKINMHFC